MLVAAVIALVLLIGSIVPGECDNTVVVETASGPVQGRTFNTLPNSVPYAVFKGIPYAKAPIGELRFKAPVRVDPWTTTKSSYTYGNSCPQMGEHSTAVGSEDCLFLNIYTPQTNPTTLPMLSKPVMFWIHGGGFISGSGSMNVMHADYFLEKDIIFVSINYRLGILGFLNLDDAVATGNFGLKDQNLALKWVHENIRKFGGDPNSITLIGHGAGAASVGYHILSKSSKDLFKRAISMSGSPLSAWYFQNISGAASAARRIGEHLNVHSLDKGTLFTAFKNAAHEELVTSDVVFAPTVERSDIATDPFITESPYQIFYTGNYNKVPQMLGFMEQEFIGFIGSTRQSRSFFNGIEEGRTYAEYIGVTGFESLTAVRDALISHTPLDRIDLTTVLTAINITSELFFISPIDRNLQFVVENNNNNPVYYYSVSYPTGHFTHRLPTSNTTIAVAGHGDDLALLFWASTIQHHSPRDSEISKVIEELSVMWASFVTHGNPTPIFSNVPCSESIMNGAKGRWACLGHPLPRGKSVQWPASTSCNHILDIGKEFVVKRKPINRNVELLQSLSWSDEKSALEIPGMLIPDPLKYNFPSE